MIGLFLIYCEFLPYVSQKETDDFTTEETPGTVSYSSSCSLLEQSN